MWLGLVVLYAGLAIVAHTVVSRTRLPGNSVVKFLATGASAGLALVAHLVALYGLGVESWAGLIWYALVCELYIFLFTLTMSSVSVGLLFRLRSGSMSQQQIDRVYAPAAMVRMRTRRLLANGLLCEEAGEYRATARAERLVRLFALLRAIFRPYAAN